MTSKDHQKRTSKILENPNFFSRKKEGVKNFSPFPVNVPDLTPAQIRNTGDLPLSVCTRFVRRALGRPSERVVENGAFRTTTPLPPLSSPSFVCVSIRPLPPQTLYPNQTSACTPFSTPLTSYDTTGVRPESDERSSLAGDPGVDETLQDRSTPTS